MYKVVFREHKNEKTCVIQCVISPKYVCLTVAFCYFERRPLIICSIGISQDAFFHSMTLSFSGPLLSRSYVCNAFLKGHSSNDVQGGGNIGPRMGKKGVLLSAAGLGRFFCTLCRFFYRACMCAGGQRPPVFNVSCKKLLKLYQLLRSSDFAAQVAFMTQHLKGRTLFIHAQGL